MHILHHNQLAPPLKPPPPAFSVQVLIHTPKHKNTLLGGLGHKSSLVGRAQQGG